MVHVALLEYFAQVVPRAEPFVYGDSDYCRTARCKAPGVECEDSVEPFSNIEVVVVVAGEGDRFGSSRMRVCLDEGVCGCVDVIGDLLVDEDADGGDGGEFMV